MYMYLYLDVSWAVNKLLDEHATVFHSCESLLRGKHKPLTTLLLIPRNPHPLPPSPCTGLQHHWVACC